MDSSQAPLMADNREGDDAEAEEDNVQQGRLTKDVDANPGVFVVALTIAAGISGLLFGYDTGVISATLVSIGTSLSNRELTSMDKSVITSSTSLFALLISPFSSVLADRLGRKRVVLYADILFILGAVLQAICSTVPVMIAGRCIIGAGIGAASFVVPLYIAELAPASHRGRLVTATVLFITLGQMVAYVVGWAFSAYGSKETGWRWMVGLGALPAGFQAAIVVFMPETPRWLVKAGKPAQAKTIIQRNSLMYFSATIFTAVGFSSPTLTSLTVAITNFVFTLVALGLVDRIGRRRVLLYSIPFMILGLVCTAVGFSFLLSGVTNSQTQPQSESGSQWAAYVILISIMLYVASYGIGLGNVPWMQSELFPLSVRSLGSGIATATNWSANFIIGLTFLPLMDALSPSWTFVLYALVCGIGYALVWQIYPETAGLSLEEATALLERGWGV
ncbi:hypothetical protein H633G_06848 [Metarhizium anisopliae BRIP 53284]|nr:hypothetical protein H633G_06848 [Metarhizium anisopliae BRIP 53284]